MSLKYRITLSIVLPVILIFAISTGYFNSLTRNRAIEESKANIVNQVRENASKIEGQISRYYDALYQIEVLCGNFQFIPDSVRREIISNYLKKYLENQDDAIAIWSIWEKLSIDNLDSLCASTDNNTSEGAFSPAFFKSSQELFPYELESVLKQDTMIDLMVNNLKGDRKEEFLSSRDILYDYNGNITSNVISIGIPIIENNSFFGSIGFDFPEKVIIDSVKNLREICAQMPSLLSSDGRYIYSQEKKKTGLLISKSDTSISKKYAITEKIHQAKAFSFLELNDEQTKVFHIFAPIRLGNSGKFWFLSTRIPYQNITKVHDKDFLSSMIFAIVSILVLIIIAFSLSRYIVKPIKRVTKVLQNLANGTVSTQMTMTVKSKDEIGKIRKSLNQLIEVLDRTVNFAKNIGKGNLEIEYTLTSDKDTLGNALLDMRKSLQLSKIEAEKREEEERKLNWQTNGLAKFSELLRNNNNNLGEFGYSMISNIIDYTQTQVGGIFFVNEENKHEPYLYLAGSYAYDRRKYLEKKIELGIGLIGRCFQEAETIYMTDIPKNYISIKSGLGEDNAAALLLIPIKYNEKVMGVIELASFSEIPHYKIEFIEKIGESIGAVLMTVQNNIRTNELLKESKLKSEMLSQHDEEMQQNLEELSATQEELSRKANEFEAQMKLYKNLIDLVPFPVFVKNELSQYIIANKAQSRLFAKRQEEFMGKTDAEFLSDIEEINYIRETDEKVLKYELALTLPKQLISMPNGSKKILQTMKVPFIHTSSGKPHILGVSIDYSETIEKPKVIEVEIEETKKALNDALDREIELRGKLLTAEKKLEELSVIV